MLHLPPTGHPARECLDIRHVAEVGLPENRGKLATFRQAMLCAQRMIAESDGAIRSVNSICLRANDELHLVRFGPRGGHKKLWSFGRISG